MPDTRKNIIIITYWSFKDALIQAYTLPYVYIIREQVPPKSNIYLVTFEQKTQEMNLNESAQVKQRLRLQGIQLVTLKYSKFGPAAIFRWLFNFLFLVSFIFIKRIRYIHAWCTPAGSFAYVLSRITGKPLIIDSYEPHAEAMVENKTWERDSLQFKLLFHFERKLTEHASIVISATRAMYDYAIRKYHVHIPNFMVKPACVDHKFFRLNLSKDNDLIQQLNLGDKMVCVYAGKFGGIYLTREVFEFFKAAEDYWGDRFRVLLLTNHSRNELSSWAVQTGFDPRKMIIRFVNHHDVPLFMGLGDFAITPVKPIPTKRYCTPIKDGEYWAMGLPIVITKNISDDSGIISENEIGAVLENFTYPDYLDAVKKIDRLLKSTGQEDLHLRIRSFARKYRNYSIADNIYREIYGPGNKTATLPLS